MTADLSNRALVVLADCAVKGTLILLAASIIVRAARWNAALRHLIWAAALGLVLVVPMVDLVVSPRVVRAVPLMSWSTGASESDQFPASSQTARDAARQPMLGQALLVVWLMGATVVTLNGALGHRAVRALRRRSVRGTPIPSSVEGLRARLGLHRAIEVRTSLDAMPVVAMTWGLLHPTILLPRDSGEWSRETMDVVLTHELAHVKRRDAVGQLCALVACALYWYNPLVWRSAGQLRQEAERATDDLVLSSGVKSSAYAAELLRFASLRSPTATRRAALALSLASQDVFESRIRAIIAPSSRRGGVAPAQLARVAAVGALATLLLGSARLSISRLPLSSGDSPDAVRSAVQPERASLYSEDRYHAAARTEDKVRTTSPTSGGADALRP